MPNFFGGTMLPLPLDLAALTTLVRDIAADEDFWRPHLELPGADSRRWSRLWADPDVDVWLLSWLPEQSTELHDHGSSAAAFHVISGLLAETRWEAGRSVVHRRGAGTTVWAAPGVVHDVCGAGDSPTVSIHAYSPPLTRMTYYDVAGRVLRSVETNEPEEDR
jgi:predicted metal-dependent enzyme (double-stranded beta helix superfamily)